jgi:hypothetical protein
MTSISGVSHIEDGSLKTKAKQREEEAAAVEAVRLAEEEAIEAEQLKFLAQRRVEVLAESHAAQRVERSVTLCERVQVR